LPIEDIMAHDKTADKLVAKLTAMGYKGDLSAIAAGYTDIPEGVNKLSAAIDPILANLNSKDIDPALDILVDLEVELEHLENHCRDMREAMSAVYKYLEGASKP